MHPRDWNPFATCKPRLANSGSTQAPTHAKRSWIPPCSEPLMPSKLNQLSYFESPINPMETTFFWVKPPCYHVPMLFLCFSYGFSGWNHPFLLVLTQLPGSGTPVVMARTRPCPRKIGAPSGSTWPADTDRLESWDLGENNQTIPW